MPTPMRPAWLEVNLKQLALNLRAIRSDCPESTALSMVVKDNAYGHGAVELARIGLQCGVSSMMVSNLEEGMELRRAGISCPVVILGERHPDELAHCIKYRLTCCVSDGEIPRLLTASHGNAPEPIPVHIKVNTGMSRYGIHWEEAVTLAKAIAAMPGIAMQGIFTHFAMSDEEDKTFAMQQIARFNSVVEQIEAAGIEIPIKHLCNSGGFLDLPRAHFQMVRLGILPLGVYPSKVCRRIPGLLPIMTVKARVSAVRTLRAGESVGYGMRYTARENRRIAVLPIGYGDGFPRVRNEGFVLVHGQRAPIIGGVSMDALTIDITDIPPTKQWDEVVLMGAQGTDEISVHDVAALKRSVSYDVLAGWRSRLPRVYLS